MTVPLQQRSGRTAASRRRPGVAVVRYTRRTVHGPSILTLPNDPPKPQDFIRQIVAEDLRAGTHDRVITRFPPEPNGYLHVGHAKSICLNFGVAEEFGGVCSLRFDDTNPSRERQEFIDSIQEDVRWLGFDWGERLYHASTYFDRLYEFAEELVRNGKAYVDSLSAEEIREHRGTLTVAGRESPYRDRSAGENLDLLRRMRDGEFADGAHVLRARIDMTSPNLNLRDPTLYRIRHQAHPMTGKRWCIYPLYDFAHALSDAIEGVTHSLCTLEFEDHRPLYDWCVENVSAPSRPRQIEFARLNLDHTVLSKRLLTRLVDEGHVDGWDDPRMPTLSGLRRRGVPPESIRDLCDRVGVTKKDAIIELGLLDTCIRERLDPLAPRAMAVLRPLRLVIEDYPADRVEMLSAPNHPGDPSLGTRQIPFCRELYIEQEDFLEDAPRKFFRLSPGREVRLRYAYLVTCTNVVRDAGGHVVEVRCSHDPASRGGTAPDGRKVKGTIHWVSAAHAVESEVRLYDRLFRTPNPRADRSRDFTGHLNPESLVTLTNCRLEPGLASADPATRYQFERLGYFYRDPVDATAARPVFNRTVTLRDTWARKRDAS